MSTELFKAFLTGICAAAPLGPVAILTFQKSVEHGHRWGWITGLGGTVVDTVCALVGLYALSLIEGFLDQHRQLILILGGLFIMMIGVGMFIRKTESSFVKDDGKCQGTPWASMLQTMSLGFLSPAALAFMLILLSIFGLSAVDMEAPVYLVLLCVFAGDALYWFFFSLLASKLGPHMSAKLQLWLCRVAGVCVAAFGVVLLIKGIIM